MPQRLLALGLLALLALPSLFVVPQGPGEAPAPGQVVAQAVYSAERLPGIPGVAGAAAMTPQGLYLAFGGTVFSPGSGPVAVLDTAVRNMSGVGNRTGWGVAVLGWGGHLYFLSPDLEIVWSLIVESTWNTVANAGGYVALLGSRRGEGHYLQIYSMSGSLVGDFWARHPVYDGRGRVLLGSGTVLWAASTGSMEHDIIVYNYRAEPLFETNTSSDGISMGILDAARVGDGYLVLLGGYASGNRTAMFYYGPGGPLIAEAEEIYGCQRVDAGHIVASSPSEGEARVLAALDCGEPDGLTVLAWYRLNISGGEAQLVAETPIPMEHYRVVKGRDRLALTWWENSSLTVATLDGRVRNITIPYNVGPAHEVGFANRSLLVFHEDGWDHVLVDTDTGETMLLARASDNPVSLLCCGYLALPGGVYKVTGNGLQPVPGYEVVRGYTVSPVEPGVVFRVRRLDNWTLRLERLSGGTLEAWAPLPAGEGEPVNLPVIILYSMYRSRLYVVAGEEMFIYDPATLELLGSKKLDGSPWPGTLSMIDTPWATAILAGGLVRIRAIHFEALYSTPYQVATSPSGEWQAISFRARQRSLVLLGMNGEARALCTGLCLATWLSNDTLAYLEISHYPGTTLHLLNTTSGYTQNRSIGAARLALGDGIVLIMNHSTRNLTIVAPEGSRSIMGVVDAYPLGPGGILALLPNGTLIQAYTNGTTIRIGRVIASGSLGLGSSTGVLPGQVPLVVAGGAFFRISPAPSVPAPTRAPGYIPVPSKVEAALRVEGDSSEPVPEELEIVLVNLSTGEPMQAALQATVTLRYRDGTEESIAVEPRNGTYTIPVLGALAARVEIGGSTLIVPLRSYASGDLTLHLYFISSPLRLRITEHNLTHILANLSYSYPSPRLLLKASLWLSTGILYEDPALVGLQGTSGATRANLSLAGTNATISCPLPCERGLSAAVPLSGEATIVTAEARGTLLVNATGEANSGGFLGLGVDTRVVLTLHYLRTLNETKTLNVTINPEEAPYQELYWVNAGDMSYVVVAVWKVPWLAFLEEPSPDKILESAFINGEPVSPSKIAEAVLAVYSEDTLASYVEPCDGLPCMYAGSFAMVLDPTILGINNISSIALHIHIHLENTTLKDLHYWANTTLTDVIEAPANMTPFTIAMRILSHEPIPPPEQPGQTTTPPSQETTQKPPTHETASPTTPGESPHPAREPGQEAPSTGERKGRLALAAVILVAVFLVLAYWRRAPH